MARSSEARDRTLTSGALALVPMALALAGGAVDEWLHLGYSTWVSACRAAGPSPASVAIFTLQLLPTGVMGLLAGGAALLLLGAWRRHTRCVARASLAAHAGCAAGMTGGLLLCTLALPWPLMLLAEGALAAGVAAWLFRLGHGRPTGASVKPRTRTLTSAQ